MKKFITSLVLCVAVLFCCSINAYADDGQSFGESIDIKTGGYGVIKGKNNSKYYHLTPGRAGLEITNVSNGSFDVELFKGGSWTEVGSCTGITSPTWRRFYNIPKDSSDYWLKITAYGASGSTAYISGVLHDHGDPY